MKAFFPNVPIMALTGTVLPQVLKELQNKLLLNHDCKVVAVNPNRVNIYLENKMRSVVTTKSLKVTTKFWNLLPLNCYLKNTVHLLTDCLKGFCKTSNMLVNSENQSQDVLHDSMLPKQIE